MSKQTLARQARRALDARQPGVHASAWTPPRAGWVHAIREALGMSAVELGTRIDVSRQAVHAMEAGERAGTVRMSTLAAAAEAMGCQLVYAIVPVGGTLEGIVQAQAARVVDDEHAAVTQTMALEGQAVPPRPTDRQDAIDDLIRSPGRLLWRGISSSRTSRLGMTRIVTVMSSGGTPATKAMDSAWTASP